GNKDLRYIAPYLPGVAVCLAAGFMAWPRRYAVVRWLTIALAVVLMACNLFPIGGAAGQWLTQRLTPNSQVRVTAREEWPHREIVDRVLETSPYQLSTVSVLPSEPWLNQYNINYEGSLANFQVYGRNLGRRDRTREQDLPHTHWFVTLTDPKQEATPLDKLNEWQRTGRLLAVDPNFQLEQTWQVLGDRQVSLYRRKRLPIVVKPLPAAPAATEESVRLVRVRVPDVVPPGQPVPVTYVWKGAWEQLRTGQVLLSWIPQDAELAPRAENRWLHDHSIGFGTLRPGPIQANQFTQSPSLVDDDRDWFRVTERTAMQPAASVEPGTYTLQAEYLTASGQIVPLQVPPVTLQVAAEAPPVNAPPLDYVSQVRNLAREMPKGIPALESVFAGLDRPNLYDPIQNFYVQAETTLTARLQQEPDNRDYAYGILLSRVLQRKINPSLDILDTIVALDDRNPYGYAYQGFVNLAAWRPGPAKRALQPALALAPDSAEFTGLDAIANLMQGNLWGAWQRGQAALALTQD
ncbi:MAG: phospholipid carrier-dependent glycosyltransferase, partial [Cyanobacteria bacterium J06641_5]